MSEGYRTVVGRYGTESMRVRSVLRLAMIALMALLGPVVPVLHWQPGFYTVVLAGYAVAAVAWLVAVLRRPPPLWAGSVTAFVDLTVLVTLCLLSGTATIYLLPVFFVLPLSVAVQSRPTPTAALGILCTVGYLAVWLVYVGRLGDRVPDYVYLHCGFLLWAAVASTAIAYLLDRRTQRVGELLDVRARLVSESLAIEERERTEIAERLHDGPLQEILAARMRLDEAIEDDDVAAAGEAMRILGGTASSLRSVVSTLHPQVLAEVGIAAAVRELAEVTASHSSLELDCAIADLGVVPDQDLIYSVARELIANVARHARASRLRVALARTDGRITLTVTDDGVGFDPGIVPARVAQGHIGLASRYTRVHAAGGSLEIESAPGAGTTVRVAF